MITQEREVSSRQELLTALANPEIGRIALTEDLIDLPTLRLLPGQVLFGAEDDVTLHFAAGQDGLQLSTDNQVENLQLFADVDKRVIFNDTSVERLGVLQLRGLAVTGVVQLLARDKVTSGHVDVDGLDIVAADARVFDDRPKGFGVEVIQGAFTLWNQQTDAAVTITADLSGLSAGRASEPVRGSGVFVSGAGDVGGRLVVQNLETEAIFIDGGIAPNTANRIAGGVFTVYGTFVDSVHNHGPVTTYGQNDMVLDNWGTVDRWVAEDKITSFGHSGIGFVNFGTVNQLEVNGTIETFGEGARGFNVYDGTVAVAEFERIVTHAGGALGVQIAQPVGTITVRRGIETFGGLGQSLVKGVFQQLPAIALSVKPGGSIRELDVGGGLVTHEKGISPLELWGVIDSLEVSGGFAALGGD